MKPKFRIIGVVGATEDDFDGVIEAATAANAKVKAELAGIIVTEVVEVHDQPALPQFRIERWQQGALAEVAETTDLEEARTLYRDWQSGPGWVRLFKDGTEQDSVSRPEGRQNSKQQSSHRAAAGEPLRRGILVCHPLLPSRMPEKPAAHRSTPALWGGRFEKAADPLFRELNDSLPFDYRLLKEDIAGSLAWARALRGAGVLRDGELARLESALNDLAQVAEDTPEAPLGSGQEDVHSWVEAELIKAVGELGKKLHTGRSRNDQVATDLRLWVRSQIDARLGEVKEAQRSLLALAEREAGTIIPGYTHLQRAQPVLLAHWALAYFEMLDRDAARLRDARRRVNVCPLGSAALAGTTYDIDREALARELGFDAPTANSLDAVSDRDFAIETLAAAALCAVHLSRMAEELIIYASGEFGFVQFDDSVTSGSSLMPQKKNPDALELMRGKCGRIIAAHTSLCITLKGLPLAYNKDMQEDKEPLFDAMMALSLCLRIVPRVLDGMTVDREACRRAAAAGYSNATELADYLVSKGVAFRDAHDTVGRIVRYALAKGAALEDLPVAELQQFDSRIGEDVYGVLPLEATIARREVLGGTGFRAVERALAEARRRIGG